MRIIKKDLELMYKELMKILFGAEDPNTIPRDSILPLENKINHLIEKINDSVDELETSSLSTSFNIKDVQQAMPLQKKSVTNQVLQIGAKLGNIVTTPY
jgi:hypothetical protein